MKKEKYIWEETSKKKGKYLRVMIRKDGISKQFGIFYYKDYPKPSVCMEAARQCRNQALMNIKNGRVILHTMTVNAAYEESKALLVHTVKTRQRHDALYNKLIPKTLRDKPIDKVTTADVQKTINQFAKTHTNQYTRNAMVIWRHIYKVALMNDIPVLDRSAMVMIPKSKVVGFKRKTSCTHEELDLFMDYLQNYGRGQYVTRHRIEDLYNIITIMKYLGLRPQEALAISGNDIDLTHKTIHICSSIGSTDEKDRQVITTKTTKSDRVLPIPDQLTDLFTHLIRIRKKSLLFLDVDKKPYSINMLTRLMNTVCSQDGCPKVTLYMMRHMFSTDMLKATNNNSKLVQTMMGHEDAAMTLYYADQTSIEDMTAALENRYS